MLDFTCGFQFEYLLFMDNPLKPIKFTDGSPMDYKHQQMLGKQEQTVELQGYFEIALAIDDQMDNIEMFKSRDIPTMYVDFTMEDE